MLEKRESIVSYHYDLYYNFIIHIKNDNNNTVLVIFTINRPLFFSFFLVVVKKGKTN